MGTAFLNSLSVISTNDCSTLLLTCLEKEFHVGSVTFTTENFNPLLPELRKNIFTIFFNVILFRMGIKIYMIFLKIFNFKKNLPYEGHGRFAR